MVLVPEELPVSTLSQLKEDTSSIPPICHPSLCVDHIPLPGKYRDGSSSPTEKAKASCCADSDNNVTTQHYCECDYQPLG